MQSRGWETYEVLCRRAWVELGTAEQALVALGELRDEVNNGGLHQYFFNSAGDHVPVARNAAAEAKAEALVEIIDRAIALFGRRYSTDRYTRQEALEHMSDEAFDDLDREYYELEVTVDLDRPMNDLAARLSQTP